MCYQDSQILITSVDVHRVHLERCVMKRLKVFALIVTPSLATMILNHVHSGWVVSNLFWFVILALAHKLKQD